MSKQSLRSNELKRSLRAHAVRKKTKGSLGAAYVFFFFVGALVLLSFFLRLVFLLKDTKFDGSSHFAVEVKNQSRRIQVISFSPGNSAIGVLTLTNLDPKLLEIPVDAAIKLDRNFDDTNVKSLLLKLLFDFKDKSQLNVIDVFRLFIFSQTVKDNSILGKSLDSQTEKTKIDSVVSTFFTDPQILDEKLNIEIINSTNLSGLGNRLATYVTNMGGNVILVSTGDEKKQSEIDYSKDSYTIGKLSSMLNFKTVKTQKKSLPDITIIIGDDSLTDLRF